MKQYASNGMLLKVGKARIVLPVMTESYYKMELATRKRRALIKKLQQAPAKLAATIHDARAAIREQLKHKHKQHEIKKRQEARAKRRVKRRGNANIPVTGAFYFQQRNDDAAKGSTRVASHRVIPDIVSPLPAAYFSESHAPSTPSTATAFSAADVYLSARKRIHPDIDIDIG